MDLSVRNEDVHIQENINLKQGDDERVRSNAIRERDKSRRGHKWPPHRTNAKYRKSKPLQ